ncbi:hypothetical protein J5500_00885 [Candidatus Saccharibacteria bacterium]|nr:hypothetical protein [Candidatus Saccharibacteria bacterium]
MKLKVKLVICVVIACVCFLFSGCFKLSAGSHERKADMYLTEAKTTLSREIDVDADKLTVYWSGEYFPEQQYRYRVHDWSSSYNSVSEITPRNEDRVIKDEEVRRLVSRAVNHSYNSERASLLSDIMTLIAWAAIVAMPIVALWHFVVRVIN